MNKKTAIILAAIGLVLIIILAVALIGGGNGQSSNTGTAGGAGATTSANAEGTGTVETGDVVATDGLGGAWEDDSDSNESKNEQSTSGTNEAPKNEQNSSGGTNTQAGTTATEGENTPSSGVTGTTPTDPKDPTASTEESNQVVEITFAEYLALTGSEQLAYALSFPSMVEYIDWYNRALQEYDKGAIDVTGPIDLEQYG